MSARSPSQRRKKTATGLFPSPIERKMNELESRLARIEARLRAMPDRQAVEEKPQSKSNATRRRTKRCPGCTLELPNGKSKETCVWCGFRFDGLKHLGPNEQDSPK